ncbi:MAG: DNA polymerase III subunit alpha [Gammaproteobacteria bacterium]|nr:DNA polymerase III subunit alpha [Gammaproteobacteria bacterium]
MTTTTFAHLHLHSEFSLIDGIIRIKPLMQRCVELNMPAVAITDQSNLFAVVKFYRACLNAGVKPIIGAEVWLENRDDHQNPFSLLLLCQNLAGYHNLLTLVSRGYTEGQENGRPTLQYHWLEQHNDGLIALSAASVGDVGQAIMQNRSDLAKRRLAFWRRCFPKRFYLEIQRTGRPGENRYIKAVVTLASQYQLPLVATNDVRFLHSSDFEAHEARICIHQGKLLSDPQRPRHYSEQQYLRSPEEMAELFHDLPQAVMNSYEIIKRCNVQLTLDQIFLPQFPVAPGTTIADYLTTSAETGLQQRLEQLTIAVEQQPGYQQRLQMELDVINKMGFGGYFLIVADFIRWAKSNSVPVGPGRGSGAGSLVAYSLGITDLDPLRYNLLFERFLNPERVSMPDFDIDFCVDGRDRVIDYVVNQYGRQCVSQIITFGTMAAKAVIRDVGRVLGFPYGFVDRVAKLIPFELGITLEKALQDDELKECYNKEEDVRTIIDLARQLEGLARNAGKHAGGVVIAPKALSHFTALYCEAGGNNLVTQFDKDDVESIGLVKFDFLGLRNLTILHQALHLVNEKRSKSDLPALDLSTLPLDDKATFQLLQDCKTTAIFQLESRGMKELLKKLKPNSFEDVVPLIALYRPGPLQSGMADDFVNCRHGRAEVNYLHPKLEPILKSTYGVILYQEQVMQIAQSLAGYTLGSADLLRRAMGKKKPAEMAMQRATFIDGSSERGIAAPLAGRIFDLMENFAGYGFNKSHSAAYGLIAYQTAFLKAHYPAEFMAAVLSSDMDHTDKVVLFFNDAKSLGLDILPPDINYSEYRFIVATEKAIRYGLGAIKGVGEAAIISIITERQANGAYHDLLDFCQRNDLRKVNRRVLESLVRCGAMDRLGNHRAEMLAHLTELIQLAERRAKHAGQFDLFASSDSDDGHPEVNLPTQPVWSDYQQLQEEKATLGLHMSGHPMNLWRNELKHFTTVQLAQLNLSRYANQSIISAGLVAGIRTAITKRGDKMAHITLDDGQGRFDITLFSDLYQTYKELLTTDSLVIIEADITFDKFRQNYRLNCKQLFNLAQARETFAKQLLLRVTEKKLPDNWIDQLSEILKPFSGGQCPLYINYHSNDAQALLRLGRCWHVYPDDKLISTLKTLFSSDAVELIYP